MCELYKAQAACGRYFVHESEVNARMKCMTQTMAMLGTRAIVADLLHVWVGCM